MISASKIGIVKSKKNIFDKKKSIKLDRSGAFVTFCQNVKK